MVRPSQSDLSKIYRIVDKALASGKISDLALLEDFTPEQQMTGYQFAAIWAKPGSLFQKIAIESFIGLADREVDVRKRRLFYKKTLQFLCNDIEPTHPVGIFAITCAQKIAGLDDAILKAPQQPRQASRPAAAPAARHHRASARRQAVYG